MAIAPFIRKLGKVSDIARDLTDLAGTKCSPGTIYRWLDRDTISYRWRPFVARLAQRERVKLPTLLADYRHEHTSPGDQQ